MCSSGGEMIDNVRTSITEMSITVDWRSRDVLIWRRDDR